jgi:tetratricopeptide (TPR) repeat protein
MAVTGLERFPALRQQAFETWQAGAVRLGLWLGRRGGEPCRAWIAVCVSLESGLSALSDPGPEEAVPALLEAAISRMARKWRSRPARVEVPEAAWAAALEPVLSPQEVEVIVRPELPALRGILQALVRSVGEEDPDPRPGALTGAGVTVERLGALARAAAGFLAASGWRHLSSEDLIRIEAPDAEPALGFALLSHSPATAPHLLFFADRALFDDTVAELDAADDEGDDFDPEEEEDEEEGDEEEDEADEDTEGRPGGLWQVELLPPWDAPPPDVEVWERHGLPWAGDGLLPVAGFFDRDGGHRADRPQLAFFEGFFAALAATTEGDLDAGRWEKRVSTAEGEVRFVLSLPGLLEPAPDRPPGPESVLRGIERSLRRLRDVPDDEPESLRPPEREAFEPETAEDLAEALLDRAYDARGRRKVVLARQALAVWPDCAEAYNLLAGRHPDLESAARLYALGMAAGERAMGPEVVAKAGGFWELMETRPYMRARMGLADIRIEQGRLAEAAEHLRELLRLNPGDDQGARHSLVGLLIVLDRDEEAWNLANLYAWDTQAMMEYPRALLWFRREGDSLAARKALKQAVKSNRFVPSLLLGDREGPPPAVFYRPGREDEAAFYVALAGETWAATAGAGDALEWLRKRTAPPPRPKKKGKAKRKQRRR